MSKRSFHTTINYIQNIEDVSNVEKIIKLVSKSRNTSFFKVKALEDFMYGVISYNLNKNIEAYKFIKDDIYYTFGLKIVKKNVITDTTLAVITTLNGFTIFDKEDCKTYFEYVSDYSIDKKEEEIILKRLELIK